MVIINTTGKQNQVWLDKPYGTVGCPEVDEAYRSGFTAGVEDQKSKLSSLSVSGNGEYVSEDGFSVVHVDVPQQEVHLENLVKTFSANGNYDIAVHSGYDGFKSPGRVYVEVPQTGHTDEEMEDSWNSGYTSGVTDGYASGYTSGKTDGFDAGYDSGVTDGYTSGKTDAWQPAYDSGYTDGAASVDCQPLYDSGYTDGYSSGRTDGYDDGWRPGYNSGYTDGINAAGGDYASGYTDGFDAGYDSGSTDGYASGYASGRTDGYDDGWQPGYDSGVTDGYNSGYTSGKTDGFGEGYDSGFTDGAASVDCQPLYDSGYTDGYESGHTDGYVERAAMLTAMTITANGAYESVEGWSAVTVNVPQTGRTENKAVYLSRADFPIIPPQDGIPEGEIWIGTRKYYTPSSGYIGMETFFLDAELNVTDIYASGHTSGVTDGATQQKALLTSTAFTTNGTYTRTDGWSAVTVNVPQTGYTQQDLDNAYASGLTNGYDSGWTAGYDSGYTDGLDACSGVTPVTATSLDITLPSFLTPGNTGSVSATPVPGDATVDLSYTSSAPGVATVDSAGTITAVSEGTSDICVTDAISQITTCATLTVAAPAGNADVTNYVRTSAATSPVQLSTTGNMGTVERMAIDGVEVTPVSSYTFGDTEEHVVEYWYASPNVPASAFETCDNIRRSVISDRMTVLGSRAYFRVKMLESVHIGTGMTTINNAVFTRCGHLTSCTIPDSVTGIGTGLFFLASGLTSVSFGSGVTRITSDVCSGCTSLTGVTVRGNITDIDTNAFDGCHSLTGYPFQEGVTDIRDNAFRGCSSLTGITIPNSVTGIGQGVFSNCSAATSLNVGSGLTALTTNLFSGCSSITGVVLPASVTVIGQGSFRGCGKMTGITLGSGVTTISGDAFRDCGWLRGIDLPDTVTEIGIAAFEFDVSLPANGIKVRAANPPKLGNLAFDSTDDAPIYVPAGSVETYKTSTASGYNWANYANRIQAIQE